MIKLFSSKENNHKFKETLKTVAIMTLILLIALLTMSVNKEAYARSDFPNITKIADIQIGGTINGIYGDGMQRRIGFSNVTQRWYVFYTDLSAGELQYAIVQKSGIVDSINNVFFSHVTYDFGTEDYDIEFSLKGDKVFAIFCVDLSGNNTKLSGTKEQLIWRTYSINGATNQIDLVDEEILSDLAQVPYTSINNYMAPRIRASYPLNYQAVSFSCDVGGVNPYRAYLVGSNLHTSWNQSFYWSIPDICFNENAGGGSSANDGWVGTMIEYFNGTDLMVADYAPQGSGAPPQCNWFYDAARCVDFISAIDIDGVYQTARWRGAYKYSTFALYSDHELTLAKVWHYSGSSSYPNGGWIVPIQILSSNTGAFDTNVHIIKAFDEDRDLGKSGNYPNFSPLNDGQMWVWQGVNDTSLLTFINTGDTSNGQAFKGLMFQNYSRNIPYGLYNTINNQTLLNFSQVMTAQQIDRYLGSSGRMFTENFISENAQAAAMSIMDFNSPRDTIELYVFTWGDFEAGGAATIPQMVNMTIDTPEWIKEGEVYHLNFDTINVEGGYIEFTDRDDQYYFRFNETTNIVEFDQSEHEFKGTVIEFTRQNTSATSDHWEITFTLSQNIDDSLNINFTYWVQNFWRNETATGDFATGMNIYNLGGFTMNRFIENDAGFFAQGHPLEVYSQYNSSQSRANTSQVYRKLQLYHSQFSLDVQDNTVFDTLENTGDFYIGYQYYNETTQTWYDLLYVQCDIVNGAVDPPIAGTGKAWVTFSYNWYARNAAGNMASIKNGYFVGFPDCGSDVGAAATTSQFWVDIWLDKANNSRAIGGNINPYYFGMDEALVWLLWSNWAPLKANETFGECLAPLRNYNGAIIQGDELELVRITTQVVTAAPADTYQWSLEQFKNQDIMLAETRFIGIDKPAFVETLVIDLGSSGFLSGLRKAIQNIGNVLRNALAGAWKSAVGLIDTVLEFLGLPSGLFSSIISVIASMLDIFFQVLAEFNTLLLYAVDSITNFLSLILAVAGRVVFASTEFVRTLLLFWNGFISLMTGGWSSVGNLWLTLDVFAFFQLWLVAFFPFWELNRISKSPNPMGAIKDDVNALWGAVISVLKAFVFIWDLVKNVIDLVLGVAKP